MPAEWTADELRHFAAARELEVSARRPDGTSRPWVPIWVVCLDTEVYVRTWYRRDTGWFGAAVASHQARVRVPGLEADVAIEDVGEGTVPQRRSIDAAYLAKYGPAGADRMISPDAAAATLRLVRTS